MTKKHDTQYLEALSVALASEGVAHTTSGIATASTMKVLPTAHLERMDAEELRRYGNGVQKAIQLPETAPYLKTQYERVIEKVKSLLAKKSDTTPSATASNNLMALSHVLASAGVVHTIVSPSVATANESGKRISISYETWNEDALDAGDTDDRGWEDEEGVLFEDDDDGTPVEQAIRYLRDEGATEPSASHFNSRIWYEASDTDIRTGDVTNRHFHLNDAWSDEEKEAIFNAVTGKRVATAYHSSKYADLSDAVKAKIAAGKIFKAGTGNFMNGGSGPRLSGYPEFMGAGIANDDTKAAIEAAKQAGATYWIYSYNTPIAVQVGGSWYMLPGKYSMTTTRQQNGVAQSMSARPWSEFDASSLPAAAPAEPEGLF